ncbi:indoleacetamide hydrolase-like [Halichondria panicea]|uniref:indoleacetamide hydrolase-like n=1 Tax=Halichondria panicea TaxID=6063 RepID=UPI00312B5E63
MATKTNVFTTIVRPELLGQTPLDKNMTFAVKANTGCGYPAPASTPSLRNWVPKDYSPVVKALVDSGHIIVAIANMHELAFGITSENPSYGDVDNPQKTGYIPGGSSGGSAAAVAMNAVSFALGTDTGGSMRIPASLCGVVGYRPTIGLYSQAVVCPLSSTTDTIGVFSQKVTTVQQAHKAIIPSSVPTTRSLEGVRIGVPRKYFYKVLDSEVARVTEAALTSLRDAGAVLVECNFSDDFAEGSMPIVTACFNLITYETNLLLPKYLKEQEAPVSFEQLVENIGDPVVKQVITSAGRVTEEMYEKCLQKKDAVRKNYDDYFSANKLEAFVCPTTILPAIERPTGPTTKVAGQEFPTIIAYTVNTFPQALAGVPCISIPSGLTAAGLPVGLELVAPRGMDEDLLGLAVSVQAALPSLPQLSFDDFKGRL